jgi:mannan endo-1,4-beta-mannosidase
LAFGATASALEPADPDLIPEGRRLLEYLVEGRGGRIVSGCAATGPGSGPFAAWLHASGREPALQSFNIAGFHPVDSDIYRNVQKGVVNQTRFWGRDKGGIVAMLYHWTWENPDGSVSFMKGKLDPVPDLSKMVTPGTKEYEQFHRDLSHTADYLEQLAEARVPLLFRPFHEIDGGWFWWTDPEKPENTAALWRQMFDYLVKKRGIHNLIWDFAPAHVTWGPHRTRIQKEHERQPTIEEEAEYRRRFYPGDEYVDLVGISGYASRGNYEWGWGGPMEENYANAYKLLQAIAPGKPLSLAESPNLLNAAIAKRRGPAWVYDMSWYGGDPDWMDFTLNHDHLLSLDELPDLHNSNVTPNVRVTWPTDGLALGKGPIQMAGFASDRNGNLKSVSVYAFSEPLGGGAWRYWHESSDRDVIEQVEKHGTLLGEASIGANGRWTFTAEDMLAGYHQFVALARDTEGAVAHSNVARTTVGTENLAFGRPVSASSRDKHGGPPEDAVDGDPWTAWWADREEREEPQWLQVDLGGPGPSAPWGRSGGRSILRITGSRFPETARIGGKSLGPKIRGTARAAYPTCFGSSPCLPATCACSARSPTPASNG